MLRNGRTQIQDHAGLTSTEFTVLIGGNPRRILNESPLFVPFQDYWNPDLGPRRVLNGLQHHPVTLVEYQLFTDANFVDTVGLIGRQCISSLNLVLDLFGMGLSEFGIIESMANLKRLVVQCAPTLVHFKVWISTGIKLNRQTDKVEIESFDFDHQVIGNFFDIFVHGPRPVFLFRELKSLWLSVNERFHTQVLNLPLAQLPLVPKRLLGFPIEDYLSEQKDLCEFVFYGNYRLLNFPHDNISLESHRFLWKDFTEQFPLRLMAKFNRTKLIRWTPYMVAVSIIPPYDLAQLTNLWNTFRALNRLSITLDSNVTFVQLLHNIFSSESRAKLRTKIRVLEVKIIDNGSLIDPVQVRHLIDMFGKFKMHNIQVLSIRTDHFVHHDQVDLRAKLFGRLFPNLQFLQITISGGQCGQCGDMTLACLNRVVITNLKHCKIVRYWQVDYRPNDRVHRRLTSRMISANWQIQIPDWTNLIIEQ